MSIHANKIQQNKSHPEVSGKSRHKNNNSAFHFADNRPEAVVQRKLNAMANGSNQKQAVQLKAVANGSRESPIQLKDTVIQRNKHLKRFLNVATLGLRKAYTYNKKKKMANAAQNAAQVQVQAPAQSPVDEFVDAYGKSRYYQQTRPHNLPSIEKNGLLNYEDRKRILGNDVPGMSSLSKEYEGDEKKGVFLGPKRLMAESNMTSNVSRAFMQASRTKTHHWSDEKDVPSHEMYLDEKFRGGAVITKDSIPPEQVTTGNMQDLLDNDDPKLKSILGAVGTHYPGGAPDYETMKAHLRQAIRERRLSNAAFDNI